MPKGKSKNHTAVVITGTVEPVTLIARETYATVTRRLRDESMWIEMTELGGSKRTFSKDAVVAASEWTEDEVKETETTTEPQTETQPEPVPSSAGL